MEGGREWKRNVLSYRGLRDGRPRRFPEFPASFLQGQGDASSATALRGHPAGSTRSEFCRNRVSTEAGAIPGRRSGHRHARQSRSLSSHLMPSALMQALSPKGTLLYPYEHRIRAVGSWGRCGGKPRGCAERLNPGCAARHRRTFPTERTRGLCHHIGERPPGSS